LPPACRADARVASETPFDQLERLKISRSLTEVLPVRAGTRLNGARSPQ